MRVLVHLISDNNITIRQSYNNILQGLIYQYLDRMDSAWLHEYGFEFGSRKFKLFVFSEIRERGIINRNTQTFTFFNKISFYLSSPVDWIMTQFAGNIIRARDLDFGNNKVSVESISVMKDRAIDGSSITVSAMTPIEVHSTLVKPDGRKLTHYYSSFEDEFGRLINNNMIKKWGALYNREAPGSIFIKPLYSGNRNERVRYFVSNGRKTVVKGWLGRYVLSGDRDLLRFALDAGLGSRNSQGFGMVEIVR